VLLLSKGENNGSVLGSLGSRGEEEERACGWRVELEASIVVGWFGECGLRENITYKDRRKKGGDEGKRKRREKR